MLPLAILVSAVIALPSASPALAGQAASGELFFYPCTSCHPVTGGRQLPNGFKGHQVVLVGHDSLGRGDAACLACHDVPSKNPGMLKLADGTLIDIKGDVAQVCYRCHSAKHREFKAGTHGKRKAGCTAAGCHDPHTPRWIYAAPVRPFLGSGFQFKALSDRQAFSPLAPPAPSPAVDTPMWFSVFAAVGLVAVGGQAIRLVRGRSKR